MTRTFALAVLCCLPGGPARADPDTPASQFGFGYCPPPVVPACIDTVAHGASRRTASSCGRDVSRFTQTLGAYRACLTRESERAIGTGNAAIARFRCLSQGGTGCR